MPAKPLEVSGGRVDVTGLDFFLAIFICGADCDIAVFLDKAIGGFRKEGAVLNVVVADQVKGSALGEDGRVIVDRAVAKVVSETRINPIAVDKLEEFAVAKNSTGLRTETRKAWLVPCMW